MAGSNRPWRNCTSRMSQEMVTHGHAQDQQWSSKLLSANRQSIDADRRTGNRAAKFQIIADFRDIQKDFLQIPRNRNFLDWIGELSARNPQTRSAAGVIPR